MTWPGNFLVQSALLADDWVVEVENPTSEELADTEVFTIANGTESTYVRLLRLRPQAMVLQDGTVVTIDMQQFEFEGSISLGQGTVKLADQWLNVCERVELQVLL